MMEQGELVELTADIPQLNWKAGMRFRIAQLRRTSAPFLVVDVQRDQTSETCTNVALRFFRKIEA
jgi:hypothetical protein